MTKTTKFYHMLTKIVRNGQKLFKFYQTQEPNT